MKFIRSFWANVFSFFCSLFGLQFLVACDAAKNEVIEAPVMYGMPPNYGYISGTVKGDANGSGSATPLANVNVFSDDERLSRRTDENGLIYKTPEDGTFFVDLWESGDYVFRFEDGDGAENGSFKSQTKKFSWNEGEMLTGQDITLELDNSESESEE